MGVKSQVQSAFCVFDIINVNRVTQVSLISKLPVHHWVRKMKEPGIVCSSVTQLCGGWKVLTLLTSGLLCCTVARADFDTEGSGRDAMTFLLPSSFKKFSLYSC